MKPVTTDRCRKTREMTGPYSFLRREVRICVLAIVSIRLRCYFGLMEIYIIREARM